MKSLIAEDDFIVRFLMQKFLTPFGEVHAVVNGREAVAAFEDGLRSAEPYQLVCLDIMMPELDGRQTLAEIRAIEAGQGVMVGDGVKVIMATGVSDMTSKLDAFNGLCDAYLVKPVERASLLEKLRSFKLIA